MAAAVDLGVQVAVPPRPRSTVRPWERTYVSAVMAIDGVAALVGATTGLLITNVLAGTDPQWILALGLPAAWVAAVALAGGYQRRYLGAGVQEFRRVLLASAGLVAGLGAFAWVVGVSLPPAPILASLSATVALSGLGRYAARRRLHRLRGEGRFSYRTLLVGHPSGVEEMATRLRPTSHHGFRIVGAALPAEFDESLDLGRVPVVSTFASLVDDVTRLDIDTVVVISCPEMSGDRLRRLAWDLEPTGAELVVAPALVEVAGPRMSVRPVEGLPLLHVDQPSFSGFTRLLKRSFDVAASAVGLVLVSPLLLVIAVAVKRDSPGPVIFRQTRVGHEGKPFTILKFRTMGMHAEQLQPELEALNEASGPLFKLSQDPRVTNVGEFLRPRSLDELPQLVNVLLGQMSLVGPRPHLPSEVEKFGNDPSRRLLVKPGITGLWQVSGRSNLSWEESVQLDLRYIENWSLTFDAYIIWKTFRAVFDRTGAC